MHKAAKANQPQTPDAVNLQALLRDVDSKIRQSGRREAKSLASLPLVYIIGDENSAKTETVLKSGLDPELLAGLVQRDGRTAPTQLANIWLAGSCALVEAGGALLRQAPLWVRLVKGTQPGNIGSIEKQLAANALGRGLCEHRAADVA